MDTFYEDEGNGRFRPTEWTRGPWSVLHQHGGPPSALMARAMERTAAAEAGGPFRLARVSVEFLKPVPIAPVVVAVEPRREGRKVRGYAATTSAGDVVVARAEGLFLREAEVEAPPRADLPPPLPVDASEPWQFPFFRTPIGYHAAFEGRRARGTFGQGSMAMWMRLRVALVAGEPVSPMQRVLVSADSGNGISVALDLRRYTFLNPDLVVACHRPLAGEWICVDATTWPEPDGIGLAEATLFDSRGAVGRSMQTLLIEKLSPS